MQIRTMTTLVAAGVLLAGSTTVLADPPNCAAAATHCQRQIQEMLQGRAYLGVKLQESRWGVEVKSVVPDTPADVAGLRAGDRIFAINGREITGDDLPGVKRALADPAPGGKIYLTVVRYGSVLKLQARVRKLSPQQIEKVIAAHLRTAHQSRPAPQRGESVASAGTND